jgi:hypothetical protein
MTGGQIISLAEWRERHRGPEDDPPVAPRLRLVGAEDEAGTVFTLDRFLDRARIVMAESEHATLHLVG